MAAKMAEKRNQYTGEDELAILRKHHLEGVSVSDICDTYELQPTLFYPQSNSKIERWHKSLTSECVRTIALLSLQDAQQVVQRFVVIYNTERLHSAVGRKTPQDKLEGREVIIFAERKRKLAEAPEAYARPRNPLTLRVLRGFFLMVQKGALHVQHSVSFTPCTVPVHAEPHQVGYLND